MNKLDDLYRQAATKALLDGVEIDGEFGGPVHKWVRENVYYRQDTEFFIVLGITAEMANIRAQEAGYTDQFDKILKEMK